MGNVVSSHLNESRRKMIEARTTEVLEKFHEVFKKQYPVAIFNVVRLELEGGGGTQSQLLHRKDPLAGHTIFSGSLFQYLEENRKWRSRFVFVPNTYTIELFESKAAHEQRLQPKLSINCAGYKALTSMEEYLELMSSSLPGLKAKASGVPFIKYPTQFPLILWHPYARHHYFCVGTEKEHKKWHAVLQDCIRHSNNGLSEEKSVETPAFVDSIRRYRQAKGHYGTWVMMCGTPGQILANLVMETLHPELRDAIGPRLRGKMEQRQRNWMLVSDAVYKQVLSRTNKDFKSMVDNCELENETLAVKLRGHMDMLITSKEHIVGKIKAHVMPKVEQLLRTNVQPCINSILEALMEPTSRGFSEVRDVFVKEVVEVNKNSLNGGGKEKLGEQLERLSMLAFHPVKMQSCYEQMEKLNLEGLQQRFDVPSPSVFVSRAQILMREQMDNAVYTFEQLLQQSLESQGEADLCKSIEKCQERVLKKYDYDSSTVRKKFFREALLQIIIPYMLRELAPSCTEGLHRFQDLIFQDSSHVLLVENMYEDVVLQSVCKDILTAVKEAAVQRRHNLYRDSIILTNSDPNLHLLEETPPADWGSKFVADDPDGSVDSRADGKGLKGRRRQVVSMIQLEGLPISYESCQEVPGVDLIPEEDGEVSGYNEEDAEVDEEDLGQYPSLKSPDSVNEIRDLINPVVEVVLPVHEENLEDGASETESTDGTFTAEDGLPEEVTHVTTVVDDGAKKLSREKSSARSIMDELVGSRKQERKLEEEAAIQEAIEEMELAVQGEDEDKDGEQIAESDSESQPLATDCSSRNDSGFQSPTNEREAGLIANGPTAEDKSADPVDEELLVV
ncbi:protein Niban 2a [Fundulus heteroclitus]|uniref:protein Niban 2a n=1 Tax=Fundulus heteroclitus TaxID=8078 RepID=UPI00165CCAB3|nr:protein Niban 2a [Fundulus heteroclitus]